MSDDELGLPVDEDRSSEFVDGVTDAGKEAAALRIAEEIKDLYDISPRLDASFERFRRSRCDVETRFERDTEIDVKAFLEFRMKFEMWRTCNDNPIRRGCLPR